MNYTTHKQIMFWPILATMPMLRDTGSMTPLKWTMEKCQLGRLRAGRVLSSAKRAGFVVQSGGSWRGDPSPPHLRDAKERERKVASFKPGSYAAQFGVEMETMPKLTRCKRTPFACPVVAWVSKNLNLDLATAVKVVHTLLDSRYPFVRYLGNSQYVGVRGGQDDEEHFFSRLRASLAKSAGNAKEQG